MQDPWTTNGHYGHLLGQYGVRGTVKKNKISFKSRIPDVAVALAVSFQFAAVDSDVDSIGDHGANRRPWLDHSQYHATSMPY